jgi:hypothetical protein
MPRELIANSAVPGTEPPIGTLTVALGSAAAGTVTTIKTQAVALPALQVAGGQYRIRIDSEILLVTAGQNTTTHTVTRGIEGSAPTAHALNAPIYHPLTAGAIENLAVNLSQLPAAVVRADPKDLGAARSGNVPLNVAEGHVFILHTASPGVTILQPTNVPVGTPSYIELWAFGTQPITFFSGLKWVGEQPPTDLTSGLNVYMLVTLDGSTFYALAGGSVPADVVRVTPTAKEQTIEWDGSKWVLVPRAPTAAEVAVIAGEAATAAAEAAASNGATLGAIRVGTGPDTAAWEPGESFIAFLAQGRLIPSEPITSSQTLIGPVVRMAITSGSKIATVSNASTLPIGAFVEGSGIPGTARIARLVDATHIELTSNATKTETTSVSVEWRNAIYPLTVPGITVTMPVNTLAAGSALAVMVNASGGTVKLKGRFYTYASTTLTSGSTTVVVPDSTLLSVGAHVYGSGIPVGATVASITDATHIVLSAAPTKSETINALYEPTVESTVELLNEQRVIYIANSAAVYRPIAGYLPIPVLEALIAATVKTAYAALSLNEPTVMQATGYLAHGVCRVDAGATARLRGVVQIKELTLAKNGRLFTLPATYRPVGGEAWIDTTTTAVGPSGVVGIQLSVAESGQVKIQSSVTLVAGDQIVLEGKTFALA